MSAARMTFAELSALIDKLRYTNVASVDIVLQALAFLLFSAIIY